MGVSRWAVVAAVLVGIVSSPRSVLAQSATLDAYRPSPTPEDDFHLSRPTDLGHLRFAAQLHIDYALNPLVWENTLGDGSTERLPVVEHQLVGTVGLALGLVDRLVIYAGLPAVLVMSGADAGSVTALGASPADSSGVGDAYLGMRVRILGEPGDTFALGAQATVTLPSGGGAYRGDRSLSVRPELDAEIRLGGGARIVLGAGALIRDEAFQATTNLFFSHELHLGAGVSIPVWTDSANARTHLDLLAQLHAATAFRDFFGRSSTTSEALGAVRFTHDNGLSVGLAAGPGLTRGFGSPDVRVVLMVGWAMPPPVPPPPPPDPCADTPEDPDGFEDEDGCLDPDNDADGFLDVDDMCPNQPENVNAWEDTDGCPDTIPDTDGDGLLDPNDECPTEPEDMDGWQDENGCPDPDNDGDGVLDVTPDECLNEVGVPENRGCPDLDRDVDTVVDRRDNCPDVPGPVANYGCPAEERQGIFIEVDGSITIIDAVYFRTDRDEILRRSFELLENVAWVLTQHPEMGRIRIEGHTDDRGTPEHNLDLSQRRANAVMRHLVEIGHIDPARLEAVGYGHTQPVEVDADTPAEHAANRRVVFHVLSATAVRAVVSAPTADTIDR